MSSLDLSALYGNSDLTGNGPVPVQLLDVDRTAFFTAPDITKNQMTFLTLEGTHWFTDKLQLSGNAFYRNVGTHSFNGDDSPLVNCTESGPLFSRGGYPAYPLFNNNPSFWGFLANNGIARDEGEPGECPEDINKLANTGALAGQVVTDQNGQPIGFNNEDAPYNAVNNRSNRRQQSFGTTQQLTVSYDVFGFKNQFIAGWTYNRGLVNFNSSLEVGYLRPNRITQGLGYFIPEDATVMNGSTTTWSGFFNDAIDLTDTVTLTFGGRYNSTTVTNKDDLGNAPELNAEHTYSRFNPAAGLTWQALKWLNLYGSYSESARAPTIIELACSDPEAACRLPNAFLADPPLKQVVAETFEAGARGSVGKALNWNLGFYDTLNRDDIIFQSTGGATANIGYFANVGSTRRLGVEAGLEGLVFEDWRWYTNYGFIDATFQSNFTVSSPNNPYSTPTFGPNNAYTATVDVKKGDRIPGIPAHNLKFGLEVPFLKQWTVGGQGIFNSGQYLRGDEGNDLDQTDAWFVLNLYGSFKFNQHVTAFATLQNVTNTQYNTFGVLGEANELPGFQSYTNPRFLGPAAPFGGWAGIRITL
jgi:outer membrane receptor protein involved in Fe transport